MLTHCLRQPSSWSVIAEIRFSPIRTISHSWNNALYTHSSVLRWFFYSASFYDTIYPSLMRAIEMTATPTATERRLCACALMRAVGRILCKGSIRPKDKLNELIDWAMFELHRNSSSGRTEFRRSRALVDGNSSEPQETFQPSIQMNF